MQYDDVLQKIHSFKRFGSRLGLERMEKLLELLGEPQNNLKIIHVAGTNGKGSVCRNIYSILQAQGYKTGLYTSPFLERFTERIEYNNKEISEAQLINSSMNVFEKVEEMIAEGFDSPTEFEIVTAIAFDFYNKQDTDYLVLEVGLGGRGDATNVIRNPLVSVITTIGFDHTEYLGNTLSQIACEKAGIIKENCPVVTSVKEPEALKMIRDVCEAQNCILTIVPFNEISNLECSLDAYIFDYYFNKEFKHVQTGMLGRHQVENAATAITVIQLLRERGLLISDDAVYEGIRKAKQAGRFEIISEKPMIIIDGAHNLQGIEALTDTVQTLLKDKKILLCVGLLKDKDVEGIIHALLPLADRFIATEPDSERKMEAKGLKDIIEQNNKKCHAVPDIYEACKYAAEQSDGFDVILFTGSLYMIGKVRSYFRI